VRFLEEVTETHELTITERGDHSELTLADGASVDNPYAQNVVDICPVGALTSRGFRFRARVWYLDSSESICAGCSTGCNIEVHSRRGKIYRLKPRANPEVNGYWMCDYGRTTFEANDSPDRLVASLTREGGRFVDLEAAAAARRAARTLHAAERVGVVAGAGASLEEGFLAARIQDQLGGGPRIVISPAASGIPDDGKLISTDRYPNRHGLLAMGFVEASALPAAAPVDGLLVLRADPMAQDPGWEATLEGLDAAVVVDERAGETIAYADQVLAVASHFEARGTFVNRAGKAQRFAAAVQPPGQAVPGWQALAELLAALGGPRYTTYEEVVGAIPGALREVTPVAGRPASS
jgi:NADH-quinone oxidoreductase subunit G